MSTRLNHKHLVMMFLLTLVVCTSFSAPPVVAQTKGDATYIEFVFDSSLSMLSSRANQTRMQIAKDVLEDLLKGLPDRNDVYVALRVYGAGLLEKPCQDSVLVHPFEKIKDARGPIIKQVRALVPHGMTPIGYSLELAGNDFPYTKNVRNIIILITDGEESCGANPCQISKELQQNGLIMEPYVVGFDLTDEESKSLLCIGKYYGATDTESLKKALQSIVEEVLTPTLIQTQAQGGGKNITDQVVFELLDQNNNVVLQKRGQNTEISFAAIPGSYTIRGSLALANQVLTTALPVTLQEGETKSVLLDFGSLQGKLEIAAFAGKQDVTGQVTIQLTQNGREIGTIWDKSPLSTRLPAGYYDVTVSLPNQSGISQKKTVWVPADGHAKLSFDLGELSATIKVKGIYAQEDITSLLTFTIMREQKSEIVLGQGQQGTTAQVAPGTIDLVATYQGVFAAEKTMKGVVLKPGQTEAIAIDLSDVLGRLRIKVLAGDKDVTDSAKVTVTQRVGTAELPYLAPYKNILLPAGTYLVKASTSASIGSHEQEVLVHPGLNNDLTIKITLPGQLEVKAFLGDKLASPKGLEAVVYDGAKRIGQMYPQGDVLALKLAPGVYRLVGQYLVGTAQEQTLDNITIESGQTTAVSLHFAGTGKLVVNISLDEEPHDPRAVEVYQNQAFICALSKSATGKYEGQLLEGTYDIKVTPLGLSDPVWEKGLVIKTDKITEQVISLGFLGTVQLELSLDGKRYGAQTVALYQNEKFIESLIETKSGSYMLKTEEGVYDLVIYPSYGDNLEEQWLRNIQIKKKETLKLTHSMGEMGFLEVALSLNNESYNPWAIHVYRDGDYYTALELKTKGIMAGRLPQGIYDLWIAGQAKDNLEETWIHDVHIVPGQNTSLEQVFGSTSMIKLRLSLDNRPYDAPIVLAYQDGDFYAHFESESAGLFIAELPTGTYEILINGHNEDNLQERMIEGVVVNAGKITELNYDFGKSALLTVKLTLNGKPYSPNAVHLHVDYDYYTYLEELRVGVFQARILQGAYQLVIIPAYEDEFDSDGQIEIDVLTGNVDLQFDF